MNEIMKFDGTAIDIQKIDGTWMLELYSVGMALGYARSNGKSAGEHGVHPKNRTLFPYKSRIDKVVQNAEITPVLHNAKPYITESQLYDLMLEARTDKCRAFRKWLTNEVLPALNRKGSYSINEGKQLTLPIEEKPYEYFDKTWNGEPVLSVQDLAHVMGVSPATIHYYVKAGAFKLGQDYYSLEKQELMKFKMENPKHEKNCNHITLFTKSGFQKLCSCLGTEVDEPKCYAIEVNSIETAPVNRISETAASEVDELIDTLKVLKRVRQEAIDSNKRLPLSINDTIIASLERSIRHIGMIIAVDCR